MKSAPLKKEYLSQRPELMPQVAHWIYNEFWTDIEGVTEESLLERFKEVQEDKMPLSLVVFSEEQLVGTVTLVESDDDERLHLKPWLAALFVKPEYRKLGIGKYLVQELIKEAQKWQIKKLYLGTDKPEFYVRLGAEVYEEAKPGFKILYFNI